MPQGVNLLKRFTVQNAGLVFFSYPGQEKKLIVPDNDRAARSVVLKGVAIKGKLTKDPYSEYGTPHGRFLVYVDNRPNANNRPLDAADLAKLVDGRDFPGAGLVELFEHREVDPGLFGESTNVDFYVQLRDTFLSDAARLKVHVQGDDLKWHIGYRVDYFDAVRLPTGVALTYR